MTDAIERRLVDRAWPDADLEIRLVGDGMTFEGYAAVFDSDSEPLPGWGVERIARGAFTRSLSEETDVRMFVNHNSDLLVGSTKAGTLRLSEDDRGLRVQADLPQTQAGRDLSTLISRGDVRSMSFGFQPVKHEARTDGVNGTIHTEVRLMEVSAVTAWPAYTATSAAVRTIESPEEMRDLRNRMRTLADRMYGILQSHRDSGKPMTRSMDRDFDDAAHEVLAAVDRLPESCGGRTRLQGIDVRDRGELAGLAASIEGDLVRAERMARAESDPNTARLRPMLAALFNDESRKTMNSDLAPLWEQYRSNGFAATDVGYSPDVTETRALSTPGGTAIPTTFADQVVVYQRTLTPMLNPSIVTLSTSNSGAPFKVPRLTADVSFGGTITAEAAAITEADPTISAVELVPYKYSGITLWSAELDEDQIIEIQSLIAKSHARELAIDAGAHLTTGDGNGKPNGFVTAATIGGTATVSFGGTASTFFDYGDLVDLWASLAAPYRSVGSWQMSTTAFAKIQRFRTDDGGLAVLPGLNGGPPTLLGRPVYENPAMAAVASASKSVAFGDFSAYWVRRVAPMRVELSRDYKFNTDQVALKVIDRLDGDLIDTVAVKTLVSANA